jgi:hypothetical protein
VVEFFQTYDLLVTPGSPTAAFDVNLRHPETIAGRKPENYMAGSTVNSVITMTTCPAIAVPCGFDQYGRPVGLQLVGKPRGEASCCRPPRSTKSWSVWTSRSPSTPSRERCHHPSHKTEWKHAGRDHRRQPRHRPGYGKSSLDGARAHPVTWPTSTSCRRWPASCVAGCKVNAQG